MVCAGFPLYLERGQPGLSPGTDKGAWQVTTTTEGPQRIMGKKQELDDEQPSVQTFVTAKLTIKSSTNCNPKIVTI